MAIPQLEEALTEVMLNLYRRTGEATGYWAGYFLRDVRRHGGLAVAKKLLRPDRGLSEGFNKLIDAGRVDLSVEAVVLQDFAGLFSSEELDEARQRVANLPLSAFPQQRAADAVHPSDLSPGREYREGAVLQVLVNAYERNPRAREACLRHYGFRCIVCDFDFEERYGSIGREFIHVHHRRPLGLTRATYRLNPVRDLVPICPNCHAMLHRKDPPLEPEELRKKMRTSR